MPMLGGDGARGAGGDPGRGQGGGRGEAMDAGRDGALSGEDVWTLGDAYSERGVGRAVVGGEAGEGAMPCAADPGGDGGRGVAALGVDGRGCAMGERGRFRLTSPTSCGIF